MVIVLICHFLQYVIRTISYNEPIKKRITSKSFFFILDIKKFKTDIFIEIAIL